MCESSNPAAPSIDGVSPEAADRLRQDMRTTADAADAGPGLSLTLLGTNGGPPPLGPGSASPRRWS